MTRRRLITVAACVVIIGLLAGFPARVAYHWFAPGGVALAGIDGTVWHGTAAEGQLAGLYVRNVEWQMNPLSLFLANLAYAVNADTGAGFAEGNVALGIGGTVSITDLNASLSLQSLEKVTNLPGLSGRASAQFERLTLEDGLLVAAVGTLEVANLRAPNVDRASIGGYRAEFFTQQSGVVASVEDTDGVVDLAGNLQIGADRNYQFIAQVAIKNTTPQHLRDKMKFLGSPNERGQYQFRLEGQL